jgi:3-isopropylmalate/(R)-2-methylmalate dehydratase small subunit
LPIVVSANTLAQLFETLATDANAEITIDLEAQAITLPGSASEQFPIDAFERHCLLQGIDRLGFLLELEPAIADFEAGHPAAYKTGSGITDHGSRIR